jgi:hypothetical protein
MSASCQRHVSIMSASCQHHVSAMSAGIVVVRKQSVAAMWNCKGRRVVVGWGLDEMMH